MVLSVTSWYLLFLSLKLLRRVIFEERVESKAEDIKFPTDRRYLESISSKLKVLKKLCRTWRENTFREEMVSSIANRPPHIELYRTQLTSSWLDKIFQIMLINEPYHHIVLKTPSILLSFSISFMNFGFF